MMRDFRIILVIVSILVADIHSAVAQLPVPEGRRLRDIVADKYPDSLLLIGGTTGSWAFTEFTGQLMDREFSYVTPENDFKQSVVRSNPGAWNWSRADAWLQHIIDNDQVLRIHGPIAPQCSNWAKDDSRTAEELEQELDTFMTALCMRYNNVERIKYLDVVNEIALDNGSWHGPKTGTDSWENPWLIIGQDTDPNQTPLYIRQAFAIANEHAPNLKLILNNHCHPGTAGMEKNKETILYLRDLGYRVDGLGWQAHVDVGWATKTNLQHLRDVIDWCQERDLEFHVTEFDAWIRNPETQSIEGQAYTYKAIMDVMLEKLDSIPMGWNTWHVTDATGWHTERIPALFDDKYKPKPAYYAFQLALETRGDYTTLHEVTFHVRNSETGDTLEGSSLLFNEETQITDSKGMASFDSVTPGMYSLTANRQNMDQLEIGRISIYSDTVMTIWMDSADFEVTFKLMDSYNGNPVPFVNILIGGQEKKTDLAGTVSFIVRPGTRTTHFQKESFADLTADFIIVSDTTITIPLDKTHADVEFWLKTGGSPVNDALVVLGEDSLYTNLLGMCTFPSLPVNSNYSYSIKKEFYKSSVGDFFLPSDTAIELQFLKSVARIDFVLDAGSGNAQNAFVVLDSDSTWFNKDGMARFYHIPLDTTYAYRVVSDNYPDFSGSIFVQEDTAVTVSLTSNYLQETSTSGKVVIYPNPATDHIHIRSGSGIEFIGIYNNNGILVEHFRPTATTFRADLSNLTAGCYWIKTIQKGKTSEEVQPVIVK